MDEDIYLMRLRSFKRGKKIQLFHLNQIVIPFEGIARENTGMTFKLVLFCQNQKERERCQWSPLLEAVPAKSEIGTFSSWNMWQMYNILREDILQI